MASSMAKRLVFLSMAISLLLLCFFSIPSYSVPLCFGRFPCTNGGRRLPYYPPPPVENRQNRQDDPRAPPISDQSAPPSPSTII
ncbi:hypothetical protein M5K25_024043 [Dendrobium thyrsiflorum]|uniref:Transmembrane protein n=1 Tax=Dendrobium thyrsiflorum TaxID=117978 RepID=A0ABD0U110_DENTH